MCLQITYTKFCVRCLRLSVGVFHMNNLRTNVVYWKGVQSLLQGPDFQTFIHMTWHTLHEM